MANLDPEKVLDGMFHAIRMIQVDRAVPASYIQALLFIATRKGTTVQQLVEALDMDQSGVKRITDNLSAYGRPGHLPGLGLIEGIDDPLQRARKLFFVTKRGGEKINQMLRYLSGEMHHFKPLTASEFMKSPKLWEVLSRRARKLDGAR